MSDTWRLTRHQLLLPYIPVKNNPSSKKAGNRLRSFFIFLKDKKVRFDEKKIKECTKCNDNIGLKNRWSLHDLENSHYYPRSGSLKRLLKFNV